MRQVVSSHRQPLVSQRASLAGATSLEQRDVEATIEDISLTLSCDIYAPPVFILGIEWCLF